VTYVCLELAPVGEIVFLFLNKMGIFSKRVPPESLWRGGAGQPLLLGPQVDFSSSFFSSFSEFSVTRQSEATTGQRIFRRNGAAKLSVLLLFLVVGQAASIITVPVHNTSQGNGPLPFDSQAGPVLLQTTFL